MDFILRKRRKKYFIKLYSDPQWNKKINKIYKKNKNMKTEK